MILTQRLSKSGNLCKVLVYKQFKDHLLHEKDLFISNPSSNFESKYWRFQNIGNLKVNLGTKFWDILALHSRNSKSSLLTTGTFLYVESHISYTTFCLILPLWYSLYAYCICHNLFSEKENNCQRETQVIIIITDLACIPLISYTKMHLLVKHLYAHTLDIQYGFG